MTWFLLDNSVLQRLDRAPAVTASVEALMGRGDLLAAADVSILEAGFSATSEATHRELIGGFLGSLERLPMSADTGRLALELQGALFRGGMGRAVGVLDLLHAATAIEHDAVLVHYDSDYELLAEVDPRLRHRWIVPRGSVA